MGWSIGFDEKWQRDIGYGVPAICDHPDCDKEIDRGLSHVCGSEPWGGEAGCGLFFCHDHLYYKPVAKEGGDGADVCERCNRGQLPYLPKPDTVEWISWKLTDDSWAQWRDENPETVKELSEQLPTSQVMDF